MSSIYTKCRKKPLVVEYREVESLEFDSEQNCWGEVIPCGVSRVQTFVPSGENYIIRGIVGELYPCNKQVFAETYEVCK